MSKLKTITCEELRIKDVGREVTISGFVDTIRDLGGVVDIRDMYGITQAVTSGQRKDVEFASHIRNRISSDNYRNSTKEK